ncbi:MAG: anion transporter [Acidobacteria bacterium]|nr:MAG: anion transporter [Acidobacteriota bacterium]PYY04191.1 MAG: anion transporter [Acidobacteriota bacterium]
MALLPAHTLPELQTAAAYAVFLASYLVFALGKFPGMKIDRPGAAIIGAALLFAFRVVHPAEALRFIDFSTLVLLFSMMLIVGNLHLLGFFEWIAELVIQRLHPRHLLPTVILTSGVLSAFFVNDIICLVLVPFVLTVTRRMRVPALPYLLAVATASNIGSVATITGNPQNMLIGSFSHIGYRDFLFHLGPIAGVGLFIDWAVLHWLYLRAPGADALVVEAVPAPPKMPQMWKTSAVMALVVVGFFAGVPPAMISALGAAVLLIEHTLEPRRLYEQIDWGLLVFFIGLFLIVGGAENAGLTNHLLIFATHWNLQHAFSFTVVTAALSNLLSNVPAVMLLKSLIPGFADPHTAWLILAMASTLSGNLTITGSVANIIVVERARPEVAIGFREYFRAGLPVTLATLFFAWAWLSWVR